MWYASSFSPAAELLSDKWCIVNRMEIVNYDSESIQWKICVVVGKIILLK